jgi:hypothetical protein
MTFEQLKRKAHSTPHLETCNRGAEDIDRRIYGKRDPNCPRCKMDDKARAFAHKALFG